MGKLSYHFRYEDFACKCGACEPEHRVHLGLVGGLEYLRSLIKKPIRVVGGSRCAKRNQAVAGHRKSYHLQGKAAHIMVEGMPLQDLFKFCEKVATFRGLGFCPREQCIHVDTREEPQKWVKDEGKYLPLTDALRTRYELIPY